jgi:DNA-directed RNA polymerase specialized sigma24 family protein
MADSTAYPPAHGDEAQLFRDFNDDLMRSIARSVKYIRPDTIEDACSFAWAKFLQCQPSREGNWQGWLFRTAQYQAWAIERKTLDRDEQPVLSLRDDIVTGVAQPLDEELELRDVAKEGLEIISKLPPRLRRIAELRAGGFMYKEIGEITGDSPTRVAQLVALADERISEIRAERAHERGPFPARAERLWELEHNTPEWLADKIGRPVKLTRKTGGETVRRRAWRRAALALDDYRTAAGPAGFDALTDKPPADPTLRAPHAAAIKAMSELEAEVKRQRDCSRSR